MSTSNIPSSHLSGRTIIRSDITVLSAENVQADLARVLKIHNENALQIQKLQEYFKGWHPEIQKRVKATRTNIDNKITVNYAYSITRDIVGYFLGKPIQYTNRKGNRRVQMENLNSALMAENKALVDYQIADDCSIAGVGYRGVFSERKPRNGTALKLMRLEPLSTFVVYSSDPMRGALYAVTFYESQGDEVGGDKTTYYNVYTATDLFVFKTKGTSLVSGISDASNLELLRDRCKRISYGGYLPIVEYENNMWRMGDWEMTTALMDALDAVTSDGVNDIEQAVNAVLVLLGAELDADGFDKLSTNGFIAISNIPPGVHPEIKFINQAMDSSVGQTMRDYLEATLRVIVGVPDRKTRGGGGGDTGDAVFMRDGWQDIDLVATSKEPYFIQSEREALAVMLYILDTKREVKGLKPTDIDIHFNRNKTSNLQSKAQVYSLLTTGEAALDPSDALDMADLTSNVSDVILRMKKWAEENAERRIKAQEGTNGDPNSNEGGKPKAGADGATQ